MARLLTPREVEGVEDLVVEGPGQAGGGYPRGAAEGEQRDGGTGFDVERALAVDHHGLGVAQPGFDVDSGPLGGGHNGQVADEVV